MGHVFRITAKSEAGAKPALPPQLSAESADQTLNDLSDEWTEYPINDRLCFIRFFGLRLSDRVPDAKTVRLLRERLT